MDRPKHDPTNDPTPDRGIDVQATIDQWMNDNPDVEKYVTEIYYVPDGAEIPPDVTHMLRLTSVDHPDLELRLGAVATAATAALADVILGMIGRSAADPKDQE